MNERIENLVGKHDPVSIARKFNILAPEKKQQLDLALNDQSLSFAQCFATDYLETLNEDQRKKLSSLRGDLEINRGDEVTIKQTIGLIVKVLQS